MLSKQEFEKTVEELKESKPFLFSIKEDGTLETNLFVLQEVLKQHNFQIDYKYHWEDDAYCIQLKLLKEGKQVFETSLCRENVPKNISFEELTSLEVSLLEEALTKTFKDFFKIDVR
ncbi:MAG: hypothetical protein GXO48_02235 [Chlorobi bacterium]|nr:hypothetical protein [Chlorobiota bacterium]